MLEAGVSSSLEIARFWGLAEPAVEAESVARRAEPRAAAPEPAGHDQTLGSSIMATVSPHVPANVKGVIEKALSAAGLMR